MLEKGVIRESFSPWSSPVVLVQKKSGEVRFCVDYRRLNAVMIKDSYPIPRIEDTLSALGGGVQVVLHPRSGIRILADARSGRGQGQNGIRHQRRAVRV